MKTSKEESKGASTAAPKKGKKSAKKARKGSRKKPKRPMTAYNYFLRACHDEASKKLEAEKAERKKAAADGGADDVDKNEGRSKEEFQRLSKEFGERWRNISPEEHAKYKKLADEDTKRYHAQMEDFYKDEITALCNVDDDAKEGKFSHTSTPASSVPPAMAGGGLMNMGGGILPDAALGAAMGLPFQQAPNNLLLSYLQQQNALQQQQQGVGGPAGNPLLMSLLFQQQQQMQQQQQQNQLVQFLLQQLQNGQGQPQAQQQQQQTQEAVAMSNGDNDNGNGNGNSNQN